MGFSDVLDVMDFAAMGAFEARKDRWGFLVDAQYIKVSDAATASRVAETGATLTVGATAKVKQTMLAGAAFYRVAEGPVPVDVIGGLRYIDLNVDATIDASLYGPVAGVGTSVFRSGSKSWTDPYIGVRVRYPVNDRWTLDGYLDVGGTGSDSTSYQAVVGASYQYSKTISGKFGYRYLKMDYDKSGFVYDIQTSGLYVGVGFRF
jgi:opacity protein-like surface antigen